jgi:hypothetical protein
MDVFTTFSMIIPAVVQYKELILYFVFYYICE